MAFPIDPSRSPLPPVAQFLAEAALQRQSALLGQDRAAALPAAAQGDPAAPPPTAASPPPAVAAPLPVPADKASISAQAREQLGAGFDPRRPVAEAAQGGAKAGAGNSPNIGLRAPAPPPLPTGAPAVAARAASAAPGVLGASGAPVAAASATAWPATGLPAPWMRLVSAVVAQVTAGSGQPQRVVSAQPWPMGLAQALESGTLDADLPPLQTWLVQQGTAQTPEGPRSFALTLRVPVPWLAAQPPVTPPAGAAVSAGGLQVPFNAGAQALQSGVMALVLQGAEAAAPRTSALLVLDFQAQLAATVYGRDMLQQAGRLDPWAHMALLQASGQLPREEDRARNGASGLCNTVGCPYAARAACVQPFCMAWRDAVPPVQPAPPMNAADGS